MQFSGPVSATGLCYWGFQPHNPNVTAKENLCCNIASWAMPNLCFFSTAKEKGEKWNAFFVRPMPPKGGGGIPAVLAFGLWPLTVKARKFSNAERRRGY